MFVGIVILTLCYQTEEEFNQYCLIIIVFLMCSHSHHTKWLWRYNMSTYMFMGNYLFTVNYKRTRALPENILRVFLMLILNRYSTTEFPITFFDRILYAYEKGKWLEKTRSRLLQWRNLVSLEKTSSTWTKKNECAWIYVICIAQYHIQN